jgi:ABC-type nitrate/sulfonate/bicarbonate transport system substrate-binding protein
MTRRILLVLALVLTALIPAGAANAAASAADKLTIMSGWSQPTAASPT